MVIKSTTWKPEDGLTHKKAQIECEKFAELYEQSIKKLYSSACTNTLDRKITFAAFAQKWLERVQKDFSVHYYEMSIESVKWINRYLGGFKLVEITPYIIQSFYDKLDEETYTVTHIIAVNFVFKKNIYTPSARCSNQYKQGEFTMEKRTMRHTDEIHAVLQAIYVINETETRDNDITKLLDYIFYRVYKESTTELKQYCYGKQKSAIMPDLLLLVQSETEF